jgi:hypothetical protein
VHLVGLDVLAQMVCERIDNDSSDPAFKRALKIVLVEFGKDLVKRVVQNFLRQVVVIIEVPFNNTVGSGSI